MDWDRLSEAFVDAAGYTLVALLVATALLAVIVLGMAVGWWFGPVAVLASVTALTLYFYKRMDDDGEDEPGRGHEGDKPGKTVY